MPIEPVLDDGGCPKCGAEMEAIAATAEGLEVQQLRLCPKCYLVTWNDNEGIHMRQGIPVKKDALIPAESADHEPRWSAGEPEKC